ncbi:MAG: hypothetical protein AAGG50_02985 [Bacteroidota bacterium]
MSDAPNPFDAWQRLVAEGAGEAAKAWVEIARGAALPSAGDDADEPATEQWYRAIGMVPRQRYLDLLDRCEQLRRKLEDAEARLERLHQSNASTAEVTEVATEMMASWQDAMRETFQAQAAWMKAFEPPEDASPDKADASPESDKPGEG